MALAEVETAEEQFTPRRYEPWRSNPEHVYGKQEIHRIVEDAIQSLPEIYREAFVLRDIEELSAEDGPRHGYQSGIVVLPGEGRARSRPSLAFWRTFQLGLIG